MARVTTPEADALLDQEFPVLDKGFVRLVDYLGGDARIVQAARVSYGSGTKTVREDRALIDYLMRHAHTSPFEMVELTFHIKAPIFVVRQWFRHRTACLSGDVALHFDEPAALGKGKRKLRRLTLADFHRKWHEDYTPRLSAMNLRMCNEETGEIEHTQVVDIWQSGVRPVFEVTLENGYRIKMTKDHRCLTEQGWLTLEQATGLRLSKNGNVSWRDDAPSFAVNGLPIYQDRKWLEHGQPYPKEKPKATPIRLMRSYAKVSRIAYIGMEMTYDLEVAGPYHNFVAGGFIVHNSVNEVSARYSVMKDEFYLPAAADLRAQGKANRQVGEGALPAEVVELAQGKIDEAQKRSYASYQALLDQGIARELAREVLPVGLYTEFYWKQDLHNLFHFLRLRMDWHAQYEIRAYGDAIARVVRAVAPMAYAAFEENVLYGCRLAKSEIDVLRELLDPARLQQALDNAGMKRSRQLELFKKLGLSAETA